jgi:UDP-N-acetyl-D-mannosaminuronic acid transferase (WecB/TagA/CpsF family)
VKESRTDIVLVGSRHGHYRYWLADHYRDLDASVTMGVGRAFDLYSGRLCSAPKWANGAGVGDACVAIPESGKELGTSAARKLARNP